MDVRFEKVKRVTPTILSALENWENDASLRHLTSPRMNKEDLEHTESLTVEEVEQRLNHTRLYLIYADGQLIGEMNYMVDPGHLFQKKPGTAWIGITIGESEARGKGIGGKAIRYLEKQIKAEGCKRIELGVFEFNTSAHHLYKKLGYREIGRIPEFTYWKNQMWSDIRMEKML